MPPGSVDSKMVIATGRVLGISSIGNFSFIHDRSKFENSQTEILTVLRYYGILKGILLLHGRIGAWN